MRQIVLDTETTGLNPRTGDRIIEVGCVEIFNRKLTGNNFHRYINPERDSDEAALAVHGLTTEFLSDKPKFHEIAHELREFVGGVDSGGEVDAREGLADVERLAVAIEGAVVVRREGGVAGVAAAQQSGCQGDASDDADARGLRRRQHLIERLEPEGVEDDLHGRRAGS